MLQKDVFISGWSLQIQPSLRHPPTPPAHLRGQFIITYSLQGNKHKGSFTGNTCVKILHYFSKQKKKKLAKQLPLFLIPGICLLTKPGSPPNLSKSKKRVEYPLVWFIISQSDSPKAKFSFRCIDVLFCFFSHQKRKRHNHSREFYSSVIQIKTHTYRTMQQWHT